MRRAILGAAAAGIFGWLGGINYSGKFPITQASTESLKPASSLQVNRTDEIMKYGLPGTDNIRVMQDYVISYDRRNKVPHWVFEHLTQRSFEGSEEVSRSKCDFFEDEHIHPYFRSQNSDYKYSGYDRGHLAAAGNHKQSQDHLKETFVLSNMAPQVGKGFNRDTWNRLEKYVRKLVKKAKHVYVCTGPLYLPKLETDGKLYVKYEVIGKNNIAVPTHFFKAILVEKENQEFHLETYVLPNTPISNETPLKSFLVPLNSLEKASGLLIFERLPKHVLRCINGNCSNAPIQIDN